MVSGVGDVGFVAGVAALYEREHAGGE